MTRKINNGLLLTNILTASIAGSTMTQGAMAKQVAQGSAVNSDSDRGSQTPNSSTWYEYAGGEEILVEGTLGSVKQPIRGYSAKRLAEQRWRSEFRERIE